MKRGWIILCVFGSMILQGCLVYQRRFDPVESGTDHPAFKVQCHLNRYVVVLESHRLLRVDVNFSDQTRSQQIKNIAVNIIPEKKLKFQLTSVSMSSGPNNIMASVSNKYQKNSFAELPETERLTTINGSGVNYTFEYQFHKNLNAKSLKIEVIVTFENGEKLSASTNYLMSKSHYWTLH